MESNLCPAVPARNESKVSLNRPEVSLKAAATLVSELGPPLVKERVLREMHTRDSRVRFAVKLQFLAETMNTSSRMSTLQILVDSIVLRPHILFPSPNQSMR